MGNKLGIHNKIEALLKETDDGDECTFTALPERRDNVVEITTDDGPPPKKLNLDGDEVKPTPNLQQLLASPLEKRSETMKTDSPTQEPDTTYQDLTSESGRKSTDKDTCEKPEIEPHDKISFTTHIHRIIDEHMVAHNLEIQDFTESIGLTRIEYFPRLNYKLQSLQVSKSSSMLSSTAREGTRQGLSDVHQKSKANASTVNSYSEASSLPLCNPPAVVASSPKSSCTVTPAFCSKSISASESLSQRPITSVSNVYSKPNKASLDTVTMLADTTHSDDQQPENDLSRGPTIKLIRHLVAEEIAKEDMNLKSIQQDKIDEVVQTIAVKLAKRDVKPLSQSQTDRKRTVHQRDGASRNTPGCVSRMRTSVEGERPRPAIEPKVRRTDNTYSCRTPLSGNRLPQGYSASVRETGDASLPQIASVYSTRALDLTCGTSQAPGKETTETLTTKVKTERAGEEGQRAEGGEQPLDLSVSKGKLDAKPEVESETPPGPQPHSTLHYPPQQTQSPRFPYPPLVYSTERSNRAPENACANPRPNRLSIANSHPTTRTYPTYPHYYSQQRPSYKWFPHPVPPKESYRAYAAPVQTPYPPAFFPPPLRPAAPPPPSVTAPAVPHSNRAGKWLPYTRFPIAYSNRTDPSYQN